MLTSCLHEIKNKISLCICHYTSIACVLRILLRWQHCLCMSPSDLRVQFPTQASSKRHAELKWASTASDPPLCKANFHFEWRLENRERVFCLDCDNIYWYISIPLCIVSSRHAISSLYTMILWSFAYTTPLSPHPSLLLNLNIVYLFS